MRVFVTGATGFIGSAVTAELLAAGHQVTGLARSDAGAEALAAAGAQVRRGVLEDLDGLKAGAAGADGVIHLAFNHDFSRFIENCADDRRAIEAMASALAGSGRPLLVTSGVGLVEGQGGRPAAEDDVAQVWEDMPRAASEALAADWAGRGANVGVVRLPQVHDVRRQGLVSFLIGLARQAGAFACAGDGKNRWAAAHVSDVARLYRLALERAERGAVYHAVAEEGVALRDIAATVSRRLDLPVVSVPPEEAPARFGWLGHFAGRDLTASSERTRERLGWRPTGPGLIADLERLELEPA